VKKKIFKNLGWKLGGLLLAFILWFHLATEQQFQKELPVDIKYVNTPAGLVLGPASQKSAYIRITTSGKILFKLLYFDRIELLMDIHSFTLPGRYSKRFSRDQLTIPAEMTEVAVEFIKLQTCEFELSAK
jgi:hypothetical protein